MAIVIMDFLEEVALSHSESEEIKGWCPGEGACQTMGTLEEEVPLFPPPTQLQVC